MCATPLITQVVNDDGILRAACPVCGWIHFPTNAMGVNLVIRAPGGIALFCRPANRMMPPQPFQEGKVAIFPLDRFPAISPNRKGSRRAMELFLAQTGKG